MTIKAMPPGQLAGKYIKSLVVAGGDIMAAAAYAEGSRWPRVAAALTKAAVAPHDLTDTALAPVGADFIDAVRPLSALDQLTGAARVPFGVKGVMATGGAAAAWVADGAPMPLSVATFDVGASLEPRKVAALAAITVELARAAGAEAVVLQSAAIAMAAATDAAFLDPSVDGTGASPASITFGIAPSPTPEVAAAAVAGATGANPAAMVWIMSPATALKLAGLRAAPGDGPALYPAVGGRGGTLLGFPVITASSVPATLAVLVDASFLRIAGGDEAELMSSGAAALQMEDAPTAGETNVVSMFQTNSIAIRAVRFLNWGMAGAGHVAWAAVLP